MRENTRREPRRRIGPKKYSICWRDQDGKSNSAQAESMDVSAGGVRLRCDREIAHATVVFIQAEGGQNAGYGIVRHCTPGESGYYIGLELEKDAMKTAADPAEGCLDFYEFLQISPKAESATIARVYRYMASRFHPDNPETGDPEKFLKLKEAYEVLSDPQRRATYDAAYQNRQPDPNPIFESSLFVNGIEGEINRRLGILAVLYQKRRTSPHEPRVSLFDMELRMAFPREYLDFATWYLKSKHYITVQDNSDFELTALGVDYVESNAQSNSILRRLLKSGPRTATDSNADSDGACSTVAQELRRLGPCSMDDTLGGEPG
jgi:curved DNA-binding protein CbpA